MPAALRFVLKELVVPTETGEDEDDGSWKEEWLTYCREQLGAADDPREISDDNEKANWIDDAVRRFAENCGFVTRIAKMGEES